MSAFDKALALLDRRRTDGLDEFAEEVQQAKAELQKGFENFVVTQPQSARPATPPKKAARTVVACAAAPAVEPLDYAVEAVEGMKRKALQGLCKKHSLCRDRTVAPRGLNSTNVMLRSILRDYHAAHTAAAAAVEAEEEEAVAVEVLTEAVVSAVGALTILSGAGLLAWRESHLKSAASPSK